MKRFFGILILVLIIAGARLRRLSTLPQPPGGQPRPRAAQTSGTFTQIVTAQRGDLSSAITVVGELAAVQSADLAFEEMSGTAPAGDPGRGRGQHRQGRPGAGDHRSRGLPTGAGPGQERPAGRGGEAGRSQGAGHRAAISRRPTWRSPRREYQIKQAQSALDDLLNPDLDELQQNVADAKTSLTQAQASLLSAQTDTAAKDQLEKLQRHRSGSYGRARPAGRGDVLRHLLPGSTAGGVQQDDERHGHPRHHRNRRRSSTSSRHRCRSARPSRSWPTAQKALADAQDGRRCAHAGEGAPGMCRRPR